MKKFHFWLLGIVTGFVNGIFGSGGGILAVPMLKKAGLDPKKSHATSLAITLPLSIVSVILYGSKGSLPWSDVFPLFIPGLSGAIVGGFILKRISGTALKRTFGAILLAAGIRMFLR